jgi:hypothetical protein
MIDAKTARMPRPPRATIQVTQQHIDTATPKNSGHCMIADALKAAFPDAQSVAVDVQTIRWTDPAKSQRYIYLTPRSAQVALVRWDQGIVIEPFSFKLKGAQIIRAKRKGSSGKAESSSKAESPIPRRAALHSRKNPSHHDAPPEVVGGRSPPKVSYNNRREFGLRAMGR